MKHGSYEAEIVYDASIDSFVGNVNVGSDCITFEGRSVDELRSEFAAQVAFYEEHVAKARQPMA